MPLILSGSVNISGSMTATTIIVSAAGGGGMVSSSQQIQNYNLFAVTSSANTFYGTQTISGSLIVSSSAIFSTGSVGIGRRPEFSLDVDGDIAINRFNKLQFTGGTVGDRARSYLTGDGNNNIFVYGPSSNLITTFGYTGDVTIANGNLIMGASGKGIDFSATANSGSTTPSEILSDYEEGTWIPTISFGGASVGVTYDSSQPNYNKGTYTKVGRQVTAIGYLVLSSKGSSTGDANINGLPFTNLSGTYCPVSFAEWSSISFADTFHGYTSGTSIVLEETTNAGTLTRLTDANFQSNSGTLFTLTYFV
jgi:hypothetical protein